MADRSIFKNNLRYHRIVAISIVLIYIWAQYQYSSGNWSYTNGQPKVDGQHLNGTDEGPWTWFYENGKKQMHGNFVHGKRNGTWTIWDKDGNKLSESNYEDDKLNGKFTRWYSNGKIESEGAYKDDKLISATYYKPDGALKKVK
ncbi:MAG: hypothetical protein JNL63_09695 [Bacteroidia bacterium]|nr:hypothetical protein [Bacteroidia bacterium]